jgi:hypothetical protein
MKRFLLYPNIGFPLFVFCDSLIVEAFLTLGLD